jgi:3-oxoacyl-[acyl-carrier protein] reductase
MTGIFAVDVLEGRTALVTGASRGIGAAIADALADAGARVIGTATSEAGARAIGERLGAAGEGAVLNVADPTSVDALTGGLGAAPDILVNNAGITRDNLLLRMKPDEWDEILQTNLSGVYRMSKACLRGMMKKRAGSIISIASVVGVMGNAGQSNYAGALEEGQQESLLGRIPLGRLGEADDIAAATVFLASPAGAYITGETLHVNGGMYMI